jgi:hypothetical protein
MALFHRHPDAELVSVSWERSVDIEHQEWVEHKSEARPMPFDDVELRNERQEKEVYYESVTEWETDSDGNSSPRTAQERRTRMVWKWEQLEWCTHRTVEATGDSQADVDWPPCDLEDGEREGEQHEKYAAVFQSTRGSGKHKTHKTELAEETWLALEIGTLYHLELGLFGGIKNFGEVDSP